MGHVEIKRKLSQLKCKSSQVENENTQEETMEHAFQLNVIVSVSVFIEPKD